MRASHVITFFQRNGQTSLPGMLLLSFICLFNSCEKKDAGPSDSRDKYTGRYQVHETIYSYGFPVCGEPFSREKDTVISVSYGETDSTLLVLGRDIYVDSTGRGYDYHYGLSFRNDSIFSHYMNGGLGCGQYENYVGPRISHQP